MRERRNYFASVAGRKEGVAGVALKQQNATKHTEKRYGMLHFATVNKKIKLLIYRYIVNVCYANSHKCNATLFG